MGTGLGHYIPIVAYLGFWVMCLVSLFKEPRYGLYYVMPFLPYRTLRDRLDDYPLAAQLVTLLLVCIIIGAVVKGKKLPPSGLYVVWVVFAGYLYCSMWLGSLMGNAPLPLWLGDANFVAWKDYIILPMIFFAAAMVLEKREHIRTALIIFSVAVALVDRSALLESLSHSWAVFDENKRTSGPIEYGPNQLAAFLAQFAMFFWACARVLKRFKTKIIFYVLTGFTMVTMIYAFSRAAYVATMVAVGVLALLKDRKLLILLTVFAVTWQAVVPAAVSERVNMTHDKNGQLESSAQERVDLWTQAQNQFMRNPVTGIGFGAFQFGDNVDSLKDTHNYYVKVLVETGVVGFLIFLVMIFQMTMTAWRVFRATKRNEDRLFQAIGLGMFLVMVSCLALNGFGDRWTYVEINGLLWVLMGATVRVQALVSSTSMKEMPDAYRSGGLRAGLQPAGLPAGAR